MDLIIKSMQLSIEKYIDKPQKDNKLPIRAAIFVDLKNMFNSVSRAELFKTIAENFPELYEITSLFYAEPGEVHFKWEDITWKSIYMDEGVNQGCPLSPIFATLVLHQVLQPLAEQLQIRANDRLNNNDKGDDGFRFWQHCTPLCIYG
jgi:hypothetical protein